MESTLIFVAVIAIVVLITFLSCQKLPLKNQRKETFTTCPQNKYRPREVPAKDYTESENIKYGEDEDINYHLINPLVPRITKYPGEKNNWKTLWKKQFMPGKVNEDNNFNGTNVRNYLDSIKYYHN